MMVIRGLIILGIVCTSGSDSRHVSNYRPYLLFPSPLGEDASASGVAGSNQVKCN